MSHQREAKHDNKTNTLATARILLVWYVVWCGVVCISLNKLLTTVNLSYDGFPEPIMRLYNPAREEQQQQQHKEPKRPISP